MYVSLGRQKELKTLCKNAQWQRKGLVLNPRFCKKCNFVLGDRQKGRRMHCNARGSHKYSGKLEIILHVLKLTEVSNMYIGSNFRVQQQS